MKKQNGITLIALVITIIVLLILAGVSISLVIGDNGILVQATDAVNANREAKAIEDVSIAWGATESGYLKEWTKNTSANKENYVETNLPEYLKNTGEVDEVSYTVDKTTVKGYKPNEDSNTYDLTIDKNGKVTIGIEYEKNPDLNLKLGDEIPEGASFERRKEAPSVEDNKIPELVDGDTLTYDFDGENDKAGYIYSYDAKLGGWSVYFSNIVNSGVPKSFEILESIAGKPVVSLKNLYECTSFTKLPDDFKIPSTVTNVCSMFFDCLIEELPEGFTLPEGVTDASYMFADCTKLKSLPDSFVIPERVEKLDCTFRNCYILEGTITINANPTSYEDFLYGCGASWITIEGSCSQETKDALIATGD